MKLPHWVWVVLGLVIIFASLNPPSVITNIDSRNAVVYDGTNDTFYLAVVSHQDEAVVGNTYWVNVSITSYENVSTGGYVTCGIRDTNESSWLAGNLPTRTGIQILPPSDSCQFPDKTQIVRVDLQPASTEVAEFRFTVPDRINYFNAVYCEAIERCWSSDPAQPYYKTGSLAYWINITPRQPFNITTGNTSYTCAYTADCVALAYRYGGDMTCVNHYCLQTLGSNSSCSGSTCPGPSDTLPPKKTVWQTIQDGVRDNTLWILLGVLAAFVAANILWRKRR